MFVTPAYAQGVGASPDMFISILPFVLIFVIMYFLIIRPQRTQLKKRGEMLAAIRRGDTVVTGGGFVGKVTKASPTTNSRSISAAARRSPRCAPPSPTCASRASRSPTRTPRNNRIRGGTRAIRGETVCRTRLNGRRTMLYFSRWKTISIWAVVLLGVLFALPEHASAVGAERASGLVPEARR